MRKILVDLIQAANISFNAFSLRKGFLFRGIFYSTWGNLFYRKFLKVEVTEEKLFGWGMLFNFLV